MPKQLRVLMIEDSADDAVLIEREMRRAGFDLEPQRVETELALRAALDTRPWDLVLSDFSMPLFDGLSAHRIVQEASPDLPFMFVSGRIGEERAADAMRRGVKDYILKDNLTRLVPAIRREIQQAELHRGRRVADLALKESEEKYRQLVEVSIQGILIVQGGRIAFCNRATARMFGYAAPSELTGTVAMNLVHPEDRGRLTAKGVGTMLDAQEAIYPYYRGMKKSGATIWYEAHAASTRWLGAPAVQWALLDITERKTAEEGLHASQRLLLTALETIPHPMFVKDREGRYVTVNRAWCERYNCPPEDAIGTATLDVPGRPEADKRRAVEEDRRVMQEERKPISIQGVDTNFRGEQLHYKSFKAPLHDDAGNVTGLVGVVVDVTAEREALRRADIAHARLSDAIESLPAAFFLYDADERLVLWNSVVKEFFPEVFGLLKPGLTFEELLRISLPQVINETGEPGTYLRHRLNQFRRNPGLFEQQYRGGRWLQGIDRRTADGGTVCLRFDITDLKNREAELRQSQKMEMVGQLTGGVAHDLNNLLQVISGSVMLARRDSDKSHPNADLLSTAIETCNRAADLTRQLLAFSRKQVLRLRALQVNHALKAFLPMLNRILPPTIVTRLDAAPDLREILADRGLLEQVVMNLAVNARDAMPGGGDLRIATALERVGADVARENPQATPGEYVVLRVCDAGTGIPPEILPRIFEPFFTTKARGQGTGLGLSTVYGIVQQHQGFIRVHSTPGVGTEFSTYWPVRAPGGEQPAESEQGPAPHGSGSILLVDDNLDVLRITGAILKQGGYDVTISASGAEALAFLSADPKAVDAAILDLMMPEMTGIECYQQLTAICPDLPVLFCSGWAAPENESFLRERGLPLLPKPHTADELLRAVDRLLHRL